MQIIYVEGHHAISSFSHLIDYAMTLYMHLIWRVRAIDEHAYAHTSFAMALRRAIACLFAASERALLERI